MANSHNSERVPLSLKCKQVNYVRHGVGGAEITKRT